MDTKEKLRQKYITVGHALDPNGETVQADCVDVIFINYGPSIMRVNQYLMIPPPTIAGQEVSFTVKGNTGELDTSIYQVTFDGAVIANNNGVVMWRQYTD